MARTVKKPGFIVNHQASILTIPSDGTRDILVYNIAADSWSTGAVTAPYDSHSAGAVKLDDDQLLLFGGWHYSIGMGLSYVYDRTTGTWEQTGNYPTRKRSCSRI